MTFGFRTPLRVLIALLISLGLLAGCDDTSASSGTDDEASAADGSTEAGTFPTTVEHKFGTTTISEEPERVVSIGYKEQDWLYEFGVEPVAVREWYGHYDHEINPWAEDLVKGDPPEVLGAELNLEKIAAADDGEPGAGEVLAETTYPDSRTAEEGRLVLLDTVATDTASSFASPLSIRFTLSHLVPQLVAAVGGDPKTEVPAAPETVE